MKLDQDVCEVCYEPLVRVEDLSPEIQDKVYRPGVDGFIEDVDIENPPQPARNSTGWQMIEQGDEDNPDSEVIEIT